MLALFKKCEEQFIKNPSLLFIVFGFISLFIYRNTHLAGMVFDFNDWALIYEQKSWKDALNSFGYPGLHQVEQFVFYALYKLFKYNTYAWYIIFALLHALVAYQVFLLVKVLLINRSEVNFVALGTAFLFLISPYAADVVISKVTVHYLLSAFFIFSSLRYYLLFQQTEQTFTYVASIGFFILSLFSLEISYALPIAILLFYVRDTPLKIKHKKTFVALSYFLVLGAFLLLHKLVIGSFIGHYGVETHTKFDIGQLMANFFTYLSSYMFFFDFLPYHIKDAIYQFIYMYYNVFIALPFLALAFVFKHYKASISKDMLSLLALFTIFLLPILNLFLVYLHPIENDRYGYLASPFILAFALYTFSLFSKRVKFVLFSLFMIVSIFFLQKNIHAFSSSGKVTKSLLDDFKWQDKSTIYILAQPENLNGARMFCSTDSTYSEFSAALFLQKGIDLRENIHVVYEMNMTSIHDSVKINVIDKQHIHVEIGDWGTWFWRHHNGAVSYATANYYTEVSNNGLAYDIYFNEPISENDALIYVNGTRWKEVKF